MNQNQGPSPSIRISRGILRLATAFLVVCSTASFAQIPVIDFTGGVTGNISRVSTRGFDFVVSSSITIGGLGFFDTDNHVLSRTYDVGLWNSAGTLLATTTISNSSASVGSTSSFGRWLENPITPLVLSPGTYVLGAEYPDNDSTYLYAYSATPSSLSGVSYGTTRFVDGTTLTFPTAQFGSLDAAFFGPMAFAVPEPGILSLAALAEALLLAAARRRPR